MDLITKTEIDSLYFQIGEISNRLSKPKSNIEQLIDQQTGYDEVKEAKEQIKFLVNEIISLKKEIGEDYSYDEQLINQL